MHTGLVGLMSMPGLLSSDEMDAVTVEITRNAAMSDSDDHVRSEALTALTFISATYPQLIHRKVFNELTAYLPRNDAMGYT